MTFATHNDANQLTQRGASSLTYDANGNLTGDGASTYAWDARNQLTSMSGAGGINPSFENLNPGDAVRVYYDSNNPRASLLGDPQSQYASIVRGIAFLTLFGPIFCLLGLFVKGWLPGFGRRK